MKNSKMKEKLKKIYQKLTFEFSIQSYKIIFIFLFPIFGVVYNTIREKNAVRNEYFYIQLYFISYLVSFIPLLFYLIIYRTKKNRTISISSLHLKNYGIVPTIKIIPKKVTPKPKIFGRKSILIIIFLCLIAVIFRHFDYDGGFDKKTIGLVYKILIYLFLCYFILKYKYFKHHYITIGLNLVTYLAKYIVGVIQSNSQEYVLHYLWWLLLFSLSHSIFLVTGKYYMLKFNINPYSLMLIIGAINSFILISIATIKYLITSESEIFSGFSAYIFSYKSFFIFMADIISQFIYNLGSWITVYYFTPLHTIISENAIEIYYFFYHFKNNMEYWEEKGFIINFWFIPLVLFLNLILSLIFNEIIIIKCCNLDYYTRIRIIERVEKDFGDSLKIDDDEIFGNENDSENLHECDNIEELNDI